ncbi:hypothetical protein AX762_11975 [Alkalibacterium sp. 20]|nr:hypothetical protein AX762_11975 [Alkalibacterium sp. 20]
MKKSVMWNYLEEIPDRALELINHSQIPNFVKQYNVKALKKIIFIGSGSSLNITLVSKNIFEKYSKLSIESYTPTEFKFSTFDNVNANETLVIAISQTGTSSGTIESIRYAKSLNFEVLTITEREATPVQKEGDYYLNFLCGLEDCNAKTKGYINSLLLLQLLAINIAKEKGNVSDKTFNEFLKELNVSIETIPKTITATLNWLEKHKDWAAINHLLVIGYGTNYGSAVEGMLKILETLGKPTSVSELGEFSHGFHRTISSLSTVILIQTEEEGKNEALLTSTYLEKKVERLLVIDSCKEVNPSENVINIDYQKFTASSINITVVLQVIAIFLPEVIGYDPNRELNEEYTELVKTRVKYR